MTAPVVAWILTFVTSEHIEDDDGEVVLNVAGLLVGTGVDEEDEATKSSMGRSQKDYTAFLKEGDLKGKRIGVEKSFLNGHEGVVGLYQNAIAKLKELGAEIIEISLLAEMRSIGGASTIVLQTEFKDGVNAYLKKANAKVKTLTEVIAFNKENATSAMPYFKQETLEASDKAGELNSQNYKDAVAKTLSSQKIINDLMEKNKLVVFVGTSFGIPSLIDLFNGD